MAAYKDEERGTWYVSFYYEDWTGVKKRKVKRGFRTKKEALNFEMEYKRTAKADMDMTMEEFVEIYFRDKCIRRHPVAAFAAVSGHGAKRVASFLNQ